MFDDLETNKVLKDYFYSLPTIEEYTNRKIRPKVGDTYRKLDEKLNEKGYGLIYEVVLIEEEHSNFPLRIIGKFVELV